MKLKRLTAGIAMLFLLPIFGQTQNALCRVKLFPPEEINQRNELLSFLAIDHLKFNTDKSIDVEISQSDLQRLKATRYKYTVVVPDISVYLDSVNKLYFKSLESSNNQGRVAIQQAGGLINDIIATPSAFQVKATFAGYYRFSEMEIAIDALVAAYPTIAKKTSIGKTAGNRDLWVVKISDNIAGDDDDAEPDCFFMGLQHAREAVTGASMIFFMQYLCEQYSINSKIKELVDNREIYILPCFNPDGWEYNYTSTTGAGGGSWRKNRDANSDGTTFGTDLNRNWGVDWGNCSTPILGTASSCGTSTMSSDTYYGTGPFSELETQALRAFAKTKRFKTAFDQHAYGPYYSIPPGRISLHNTPTTDMSTKDSNFYMALPALMGKYNGMRTANSFDALGYEVAGGFKDWMLNGENGVATKDTVWGLTGEGGAGNGNTAFGSMSSFWAPASEIINLCKGICYQNLQLAYAAGSYIEIEDASDIVLTAKTGSVSFRATRLGIGNSPVTVSLLPLENMTSGGSTVISSMSYYQTVTSSISYVLPDAITNGQRVRFIWKVETDGITYYDTVTKFLNPTPVFYDDMEGAITTNWSTATSGVGASPFPSPNNNYANGTWVFTTGGFNASKALSESASGTNYTATTRGIVLCKTMFSLSDATAAYLTFWTRHRMENFRDKVQVQISTNGTSWTAIEGLTTVQEPGTTDGSTINGQPALTGIKDTWTQERFDLDAFRGSGAVQLRFVFTSDNDASTFKYEKDEGIFIDNVRIMKSIFPLVILPVNFLSFKGELLTNKTVDLNWNVTANTKHDYYDIERSVDGNNFQTIGRVTEGNALQFIDVQPVTGNNYYRIRQVDKDGQMVYSKIISVTLKPKFNLTFYPNPVSKKAIIQLNTDKPTNVTLHITDATGKQLFIQNMRLGNTIQEVSVDVESWPSQLYVIKVIGDNNEVLGVQKMIKN